MRSIQEPFTLPKHPALLEEINEMSMRIKVWEIIGEGIYDAKTMNELKANHPQPSWYEVEKLLMQCHQVINRERENPIKY